MVVIAHGAGEHSGRYAHVPTGWSARATRCTQSTTAGTAARRARGHWSTAWRTSSRISTRWSSGPPAKTHPRPVFLLGHSMGGTIAVLRAAPQDRLDGLILSGPLAALEAAPPPMRIAARVLSALTPACR